MPPPFSIIFCGTPEFAVPCLCTLQSDTNFSVDLVITQPDKPVGKKQIMTKPPVKVVAEELGLKVMQPEKLNDAVDTLPPADFLVVVAYGQILSQAVLDHPKIAPINVHASLLPRWRGASPIQAALLADDKETGVSVQVMEQTLDTGDVLGETKTPIAPKETAVSLHDTLSTLTAPLLIDTLQKPLQPKKQNDADATYCTRLTREDGKVDAQNMTAQDIERIVRALTPWPGVQLTMGDKQLKLVKVSLEQTKDSFDLVCKHDTHLFLEQVLPPSGKTMSGADWARGYLH